ncbi:MAG: hypothetical protein HY699_25575 [Deltaproteobacteria bacterium]|nr:hypothetical protein [Deltaproteobacteria bacterium]
MLKSYMAIFDQATGGSAEQGAPPVRGDEGDRADRRRRVLAEDARDVPRSFSRFEFDTEVARGLWAEVASGFSTTEESGVSVDATTVAPRLVYGYDRFEGGVFIP